MTVFQSRCAPDEPAAILSFHSHSDRSFLDDRELALLSGNLREQGIANDLVLAVITSEMELAESPSPTEQRLVAVLCAYNPIIYERVWSPRLITRLRRQLPDKTFIGLRGEHELLDDAPADLFCSGEPRQVLGPLIEWLRGQRDLPPQGILLRSPENTQEPAAESREPPAASRQPPAWLAPAASQPITARTFAYTPNLQPIVINPQLLPAQRTFSIVGNAGCPFQMDARDNPLYAGVEIPEQYGRGCAFCTTGNHYEAHPNAQTAASVVEQIRYVRGHAPQLQLLVLKDQNPFGYLTEVVEACAAEGLSEFTLLLETRAEWFLRNAARFARALEIAHGMGARLAPFLVGIENFSQAELDRFNKGISVDTNIEFMDTLWRWRERYGAALDLSHAAFGFILFTPWTAMADLEANLAGIRRTNFDRLRGSVLLSRARLYPDTALYYLARRDGLLIDEFDSPADNASRRYGYYPSHPWKHLHPDVAHFAALATALCERNGSRDVVNLFDALLQEFRAAGETWPALTGEDVWRRYERMHKNEHGAPALAAADESLRQRFARLVQPLSFENSFAGGWRLGSLQARPGHVEIELQHAEEPRLLVELVPRGRGPHFQRSRHYDIRAAGREFTPAQRAALIALSQAIVANDH